MKPQKQLTPEQRDMLEAAADMVVAHALFRRALTLAIESVERAKYREPPPGLLIVGPSGSGKTTIARELERLYPPTESAEGSFLPVLVVEVPANPTIKSFAEAILLALGVETSARLTAAQLVRQIVKWLKARRVLVIVIDEAQHFAERRLEQVRITSDYFKGLINSAGLPIILLGLETSQALLDVNEQLRRRFTARVELSRFLYETSAQQTTFRNFLRAFQKAIGFKIEVDFDDPQVAQQVHWASAGLPAHVMNVTLGAAEIMLREDRSEVTLADLGQSFPGSRLGRGLWHAQPLLRGIHRTRSQSSRGAFRLLGRGQERKAGCMSDGPQSAAEALSRALPQFSRHLESLPADASVLGHLVIQPNVDLRMFRDAAYALTFDGMKKWKGPGRFIASLCVAEVQEVTPRGPLLMAPREPASLDAVCHRETLSLLSRVSS